MHLHPNIQLHTPPDESGVCIYDTQFFNLVTLNGITKSQLIPFFLEGSISEQSLTDHLHLSPKQAQELIAKLYQNHMIVS